MGLDLSWKPPALDLVGDELPPWVSTLTPYGHPAPASHAGSVPCAPQGTSLLSCLPPALSGRFSSVSLLRFLCVVVLRASGLSAERLQFTSREQLLLIITHEALTQRVALRQRYGRGWQGHCSQVPLSPGESVGSPRQSCTSERLLPSPAGCLPCKGRSAPWGGWGGGVTLTLPHKPAPAE